MESQIWFKVVLGTVLVTFALASNQTSIASLENPNRRVTYMLEKTHLLHRQKRWLTFELGTSITVSLELVLKCTSTNMSINW